MKVAITGASGLIGTTLCRLFEAQGDETVRIGRSSSADVRWNPDNGELDASQLDGVDAVIHLAGENIGARRWSASRKRKLVDSRVEGTRFLATKLAAMDQPPSCLVSASAIGFYGDQGDSICDEETDKGQGFLPDLCESWEAATQPAADAGIRVVQVRIGVVLDANGGALAKMLTPFRVGVGGKVGSGRQYWSWISTKDIAGVLRHAVMTPDVAGTINGVAGSCTNLEFTKTLGKVLRRPTIFPLPAFVARLMLGRELANELLLASARVESKRLAGFAFEHPTLEDALNATLRRS